MARHLKKSYSIWSDWINYFLNTPRLNTLIESTNQFEKEEYSKRILQRLDIGVTEYSVLNIHRIGIEVPVRYVYEELLHWDGESVYWPNKLAKVSRIEGHLEHIQILLFGLNKLLFDLTSLFSRHITPLFKLDAIKFQHTPGQSDPDNARYLLYRCSGGYPIGIFSIYARSSIPEQNEKEQTQLFFIVAFNFYGKKQWFYTYLINALWKKIHNRVTGNVLNRIKELFESKFNSVIENQSNTADGADV